MTNIYDQHNSTFKNVNAFVILDSNNQRVATIAFKFGASVQCYLHIIGLEMTRGRAGGGGYDRKSAAAYDALQKIIKLNIYHKDLEAITRALEAGNGSSNWDRALTEEGFTVLQAV